MGKAQKNVLKTLAMVFSAFVLCWICNQIYFLLFNFGYIPVDIALENWFYHLTVYAAFINCMINPWIYAAQYREFQRQARHLFCRWNSKYLTDMTSKAATSKNSVNMSHDAPKLDEQ